MKVLECACCILFSPLLGAFFVIFLVFWVLWTFTGIGPLTQCYFTSKDNVTLSTSKVVRGRANMKIITVPGDVHTCSKGKPYNVFAVFTVPAAGTTYAPVCVPNGLGANAVLISKMQEALVDAGFSVLSFDRFGVGLSDENIINIAPTASDVVREMEFVMNSVQPASTKWILLGPSMGSIVAQCYIAEHPNKVVGFLNMDGLPYPFIMHRNMFDWAGFIYRMYASIVWTGILRPCLYMGRKDIWKMFGSREFTIEIMLALMNQRRFFANVALEMQTMMDCCAFAERAWGEQSLLRMSTGDLQVCKNMVPLHPHSFVPNDRQTALLTLLFQTLARAPPDESVDFTPAQAGLVEEHRALTSVRSPSEAGDRWSSAEEVRQVLSHLHSAAGGAAGYTAPSLISAGGITTMAATLETSALVGSRNSTGSVHVGGGNAAEGGVLVNRWPGLVVRVMSARSHDFGNAIANSFYNQDVKLRCMCPCLCLHVYFFFLRKLSVDEFVLQSCETAPFFYSETLH